MKTEKLPEIFDEVANLHEVPGEVSFNTKHAWQRVAARLSCAEEADRQKRKRAHSVQFLLIMLVSCANALSSFKNDPQLPDAVSVEINSTQSSLTPYSLNNLGASYDKALLNPELRATTVSKISSLRHTASVRYFANPPVYEKVEINHRTPNRFSTLILDTSNGDAIMRFTATDPIINDNSYVRIAGYNELAEPGTGNNFISFRYNTDSSFIEEIRKTGLKRMLVYKNANNAGKSKISGTSLVNLNKSIPDDTRQWMNYGTGRLLADSATTNSRALHQIIDSKDEKVLMSITCCGSTDVLAVNSSSLFAGNPAQISPGYQLTGLTDYQYAALNHLIWRLVNKEPDWGDVWQPTSAEYDNHKKILPDPSDDKNLKKTVLISNLNDSVIAIKGTCVTDASGRSVIALPFIVDTRNLFIRYQLVPEDKTAEPIVSKDLANNTFEIVSTPGNARVYWTIYCCKKSDGQH